MDWIKIELVVTMPGEFPGDVFPLKRTEFVNPDLEYLEGNDWSEFSNDYMWLRIYRDGSASIAALGKGKFLKIVSQCDGGVVEETLWMEEGVPLLFNLNSSSKLFCGYLCLKSLIPDMPYEQIMVTTIFDRAELWRWKEKKESELWKQSITE